MYNIYREKGTKNEFNPFNGEEENKSSFVWDLMIIRERECVCVYGWICDSGGL